jgi:hypothetical protein
MSALTVAVDNGNGQRCPPTPNETKWAAGALGERTGPAVRTQSERRKLSWRAGRTKSTGPTCADTAEINSEKTAGPESDRVKDNSAGEWRCRPRELKTGRALACGTGPRNRTGDCDSRRSNREQKPEKTHRETHGAGLGHKQKLTTRSSSGKTGRAGMKQDKHDLGSGHRRKTAMGKSPASGT